MKQKLIALCLLPILALGHWALDFDEDFAAADGAALPYQTVAYIDINTNSYLVALDSSDDLEVQMRFKSMNFVMYWPIFGTYNGEAYNAFRLIHGGNTTAGWLVNANTKAAAGGTIVPLNILPRDQWNSFTLKRWEYVAGTATNAITFQLQGTAYNGPVQLGGGNIRCRYAYFRMLRSGVLVFNGIPVIAPSGQGALYDTVGKRLIENSGTGTITWGLTE